MIGGHIIQDSLSFNCSCIWEDDNKERWDGTINNLKIQANYVELQVVSRSSIYVICGKGERGYWVCIPDYMAGCDLSMSLHDTFYNTEKLFAATQNMVDAVTIAQALKSLISIDVFKSN